MFEGVLCGSCRSLVSPFPTEPILEYRPVGHLRPSKPSASPPRLLIILNRRAARKRFQRFQDVLALLEAAGCLYEVKEIHAAGDAARHVAAADPATVDRIALAGGDGTINDAINGVGPETPPLGLIPLPKKYDPLVDCSGFVFAFLCPISQEVMNFIISVGSGTAFCALWCENH